MSGGAREAVLGRIREGLGAKTGDMQRRSAVEQRLESRARHLIPERVAKRPDQLKELFAGFLKSQSAVVVEVAGDRDVPAAVTRFLRGANLPQRLRMGTDEYLERLDWTSEPSLERSHGRAEANDEVGLSHAVAAAAETGTLLLASGAANPVTLNFLPENQVVVVKARDIAGPYEDAFDRVREIYGRGAMPRTVNLISGPSRTGDIGGRLVTGAHGPRQLCVIIVGDAD